MFAGLPPQARRAAQGPGIERCGVIAMNASRQRQAVAKETPVPPDDPPKERGGIQSLERAFAILEDIARRRDGISLAELSKNVGLHNSTAFHLLKTMVQLGYIHQAKDTKRYRVGSRVFALASGALDENEMLALATPVLEQLTGETGVSAHFAIRSGTDIVVIARTAGGGMLQLSDRAGAMRPAHATALGKVLLAAVPAEQLDRMLQQMELRRYTAKTIVEQDALRRQIEASRETGIAYDDGEFDDDVRCVAVAVHDFAGRVAGAIGISGPIWRLSLPSLQDKAAQVRAAAAQFSQRLGYAPPQAD
jgi:DNA-binding IclR family transcriptional regulator